MSGSSAQVIETVLAEHEGVAVDFGEWFACSCGVEAPQTIAPEEWDAWHRAHVAARVAEALAAQGVAAKVEASSLGTPEAKALRATVSDERVALIVARARRIEDGCTVPIRHLGDRAMCDDGCWGERTGNPCPLATPPQPSDALETRLRRLADEWERTAARLPHQHATELRAVLGAAQGEGK